MLGDDARRARVVLGLVRVGRRLDAGQVLDDDVGGAERGAHLGVLSLEALDAALGRVDDVAALHLVEDRVVRAVDLVAAVHVGRDEELVEPLAELLDLVRRRVGAQHVVLVEVVRVGEGAPRVVGGEPEVVKVLGDRDDGRQRVEVLERREVRLDEAAQDADRVRGLEVQSSRELVEDGRSRVGEGVARVRRAVDDEGLGRLGAGGVTSPRLLPRCWSGERSRSSEARSDGGESARGDGATRELTDSSPAGAWRQLAQSCGSWERVGEHGGSMSSREGAVRLRRRRERPPLTSPSCACEPSERLYNVYLCWRRCWGCTS